VALQVVRDVFGPEQRGAQASFDVRSRRAHLDVRDRAFAAELAYGSIKQRRLLDWHLAPYIGARDKPLPPTIVDVLRIGAYQLRFMGGVDDHAAVSETVNLAWRHGHRGTAGLVNAVLRKMIADGAPVPAAADFKSEDDYLGTAFSLPTWMAAQFGRVFNGERGAVLAGINAAPQHAVRVNGLRATVEEVRSELASAGLEVRPSAFVPESLVYAGGTIGDDPAGRWSLQSEAAAMPVDLLAPPSGATVLELCSGRGNKLVQLAARVGAEGQVTGVELDPKKVHALRETLARFGITNAALVAGDAREAAPDILALYVLLDAPCSGLGIIGRHPEARWRKAPEDGARFGALQSELLQAAAARTAPGGRLVYSVCSSDPREGREVVEAFLSERSDFARAELPERYAAFARDGDVVVPLGIEGRDGFYVATLVRA